ncbi:hypothetical protein LTR37_005870 [Vermiconidia calcicola]|uniref:Uncharacterized protein n=1 Tax=Vermiconidia calcicola TaxID=1690605 RepID=A0ACC3NIR5_9PEZI|nr:hypothetical protein LTR37_005870 [Vermiconidia calcicola]
MPSASLTEKLRKASNRLSARIHPDDEPLEDSSPPPVPPHGTQSNIRAQHDMSSYKPLPLRPGGNGYYGSGMEHARSPNKSLSLRPAGDSTGYVSRLDPGSPNALSPEQAGLAISPTIRAVGTPTANENEWQASQSPPFESSDPSNRRYAKKDSPMEDRHALSEDDDSYRDGASAPSVPDHRAATESAYLDRDATRENPASNRHATSEIPFYSDRHAPSEPPLHDQNATSEVSYSDWPATKDAPLLDRQAASKSPESAPRATSEEHTRSAAANAGIDLSNTEDTTVYERIAPAVVHETVRHDVHEIREERFTREIHEDHIYHRILPIEDIQVLPPRHFAYVNGALEEIHPRDKRGRAGKHAQRVLQKAFTNISLRDDHTYAPRQFSARKFEGGDGDYKESVTSDGVVQSEQTWIHPPRLETGGMISEDTPAMHFRHHYDLPDSPDDGLRRVQTAEAQRSPIRRKAVPKDRSSTD